MSWMGADSSDQIVVTYKGRCQRGCKWTYWTLVTPEALIGADTLPFLEEMAMEYAGGHVCLVK